MHRLHPYPDVQVMFRRLLIATLIGLLAALAVALFRHAMVVLETLLLSNDSGSLVNAAQSLPAWRRLVTPALGGLTAGTLLWLWQRRSVARPHAATDYMEALETGDGCFDTPASLVKSLASLLVVVTGSAIGREGAMILLAGLCGPLFIWLMDYSHRGFVKLKLAPPWQLALGGLIVGGLSLITPAVWGNGYSVVQSYLLLPPSGALLVGIFICKLLAVLASSGSGAPGGVFTPTLFVGLAMGMLFACFSRLWLPGSEEMAIMMGLTGMAAFLAATTHAPIMSTLMICEMTGQYTLLPGLLITCVVSSVLSRTLRRDSIYRHHVAEHV